MSVNTTKLHGELEGAGVPIFGCAELADGTVRIDFRPEATQAQRDQAASIVAGHNPAETRDQRLARRGYARVLAALTIRASSGWLSLPLARRQQVQHVIDDAASDILTNLWGDA